MTTYYLNGTQLTEGSDFILNGMTYPYSWLEGTSASTRASLGIEVTGGTDFDPIYYWSAGNPKALEDVEAVDENGDPVYVRVFDTEVDEMVNTTTCVINKGLKTGITADIKATANTLLKPTDYLIIRNEVESVEIPETIITYRDAVIAESNRIITAIAAVDTIEELIEVMNSIAWPEAE